MEAKHLIAELSEERPTKNPKLSHDDDGVLAGLHETVPRSLPPLPLQNSHLVGTTNKSNLTTSSLLRPVSPYPQTISITPTPVTLHDRSTANYTSGLSSATTERRETSKPGQEKSLQSDIYTGQDQPKSAAEQLRDPTEIEMVDETQSPSSTSTIPSHNYDGANESSSYDLASRHPEQQNKQSETLANTAAPMTRGAAAAGGSSRSNANTAVTANAFASSSATAGRADGPQSGKQVHVHQPSGYQWEREEDAPGYLWRNRKAREEAAKAMDQIVGKDKMIGRTYGDIGLDEYDQ